MSIESVQQDKKASKLGAGNRRIALVSFGSLILTLAGSSISTGQAGAATADGGMTVVQSSKPLVARAGVWQSYHDHLQVKPGMETRALAISFWNGAEGRPKLTDVQAVLGGKPILVINDFDPSGSVSKPLTGLGVGNHSLVVKVFGPSGARLNWSFRAEPVQVFSVSPNPFGPVDKVIIKGKDFSTRSGAGANKVWLGGHAATILSATGDQMQIKAPPGISGGAHSLVVVSDSVKSAPFKVSCWAAPRVNELDILAGPPGQPVVISGSGFSPNASDNIVKFGSVKAQVTWASDTQITCIIPEMHFPNWHLPVTVTTHGMQSKEKVPFNVDVRVIPNEGVPMI